MAVLAGVGRQVLPVADNWRPRLESTLSERMGVPVRLERLSAELEGLSLRIHLAGLQLHDPAAPEAVLLRIPEVELKPALWQSLWHLEPRVAVWLRGLDIHLDQQADGRIGLRELVSLASSDPEAARQTLDFALRQPVLAVSESRVAIALQGFPAFRLSGLELVNRNEGDRHRLAGSMHVDGSADALQLNLDLHGDALDWQRSRLDFWVHLPVLNLDAWLPAADVAGLRLKSLTGGGEYWFGFRKGQLQSLQGRPLWREAVLDGRQGPLRLQDMQGQFAWTRQGTGWQLAGNQLRGSVEDKSLGDKPWPLPVLALQSGPDGMSLAAQQVDVGALSPLLGRLPLTPAALAWLREAAPQGRLTAMRADWQQAEESGWQPVRVEADARRLSLAATPTQPGVEGAAGWLRWTPEQSWLGIDARDAKLDLRQVLREPVALQRISGNFRLRHDATGWRLDSDQVQLANADARGNALLRLVVPEGDPGAARLALLAGIQNARAASTWRYVPWTQAGDETLAWLKAAIQGGRVSQGDFLYDGPLQQRADLPEKTLQMRFAVEGGRLDYGPGWPALRELSAVVHIDGHHLEIQGKEALLLEGSRGRSLHAEIADLGHPVLKVAGDIQSNGADLGRLFRDSPLKADVGAVAEVLDLDGPVSGRLVLTLPLGHEHAAPEVEVSARLAGNRLLIRPADLVASNLQGQVNYSSVTGLQATGVQANLLESPVRADIGSRMRNGELGDVQVDLAGRAGVPALRRWLGNGLLQFASGTAPYQARVTIPGGHSPLRLQLDSTLAGLRLDLPAPLGKGIEASPLSYQSTLGGKEQMARLRYGQGLSAGMVWRGGSLHRALVRLDADSTVPPAAAWPEQAGLELEGRLASLDLRQWQPLLQRFRSASNTVSLPGELALPALSRLQLESRQILTGQLRLANVHIGLQRQGDAWKLALASDELAGHALLPDAVNREISLGFTRLQWPLPAVDKGDTVALNPFAGLGSRPILVKGEGLRLAAWPGMGVMGLDARLLPSPYGLRIEDIAIDSPVLDFKGRLDWQWRGGVSTRLRGNAVSRNVAGLLSALGYAPSMVSDNASAVLDLSWPGTPDAPVLSGLEGSMNLHVEQGRLLNISNSTSASRVFGWLDIDNLRRRFKGDFSDVLRRGLSFDSASLAGPLQAGVMSDAHFEVTGPTLRAQGHGRLDLARQEIDQQFTVVVPVTSAVPVAAIVVAGPLVGGAVAAAQLAFERQIDKVTQLRYHVTGDWTNPRVERLNMKVFDLRQPPAVPAGQLSQTAGASATPVSGKTSP